jgi:Asp/Glu/hydantoin racemase
LKQALLINPNSSRETTAMMVEIARATGPHDLSVIGATAKRAPRMIVTAEQLAGAAAEVVEIGSREAAKVSGIVIGAFGDPGLQTLRKEVLIPVVGLCEASMLEAATGGRRFGVATVTPDLAASIEDRVHDLGLRRLYTGIRLTHGDPVALATDAARLEQSLGKAVAQCFEIDHAQAVIIGGGPLGQAAIALAKLFPRPIIAPIPAAIRRLVRMMRGSCSSA